MYLLRVRVLFPLCSCCTLFTALPEITSIINCFINSFLCSVSLGTWLLFKTGRSAATLFPAKRKITLVSNVPWGWAELYDVFSLLYLHVTVMSPEPHRHYASMANPALKVKKKLKVSSEGPLSILCHVPLTTHPAHFVKLYSSSYRSPHTTLLVCSRNSSQAPPPKLHQSCQWYISG